MKTLYTKTPDKNCYEVEPGIYGRPCHTAEQPKLRKLGWSNDINSLRGKSNGIRKDEEEGRKEEVEVTDMMTVTVDDMKPAFQKSIRACEPALKDEDIVKKVTDKAEDLDYEMWALAYEAKFGKKPHHKAKAETLRQKVEEDDA